MLYLLPNSNHRFCGRGTKNIQDKEVDIILRLTPSAKDVFEILKVNEKYHDIICKTFIDIGEFNIRIIRKVIVELEYLYEKYIVGLSLEDDIKNDLSYLLAGILVYKKYVNEKIPKIDPVMGIIDRFSHTCRAGDSIAENALIIIERFKSVYHLQFVKAVEELINDGIFQKPSVRVLEGILGVENYYRKDEVYRKLVVGFAMFDSSLVVPKEEILHHFHQVIETSIDEIRIDEFLYMKNILLALGDDEDALNNMLEKKFYEYVEDRKNNNREITIDRFESYKDSKIKEMYNMYVSEPFDNASIGELIKMVIKNIHRKDVVEKIDATDIGEIVDYLKTPDCGDPLDIIVKIYSIVHESYVDDDNKHKQVYRSVLTKIVDVVKELSNDETNKIRFRHRNIYNMMQISDV